MKVKRTTYEKRKSRTGYIFLAPWIFATVLLLVYPIIFSLSLSFSDIKNYVTVNFYQMAEMPGNIVAYVLIAIVGNVLVVVLEGLSAGIQSLRLNYYEFFTKYFTGHGIAFEPVGLKSRIVSE